MKVTSKQLKWFLPLCFVLALAPFTPKLDLLFANAFYRQEAFSDFLPFTFAYHYAIYPSFIFALICGVLFLASFVSPKLEKNRLAFLFLALIMLLGPGLLINLVLKGFLVRARPIQTLPFGGQELFKPFYHFSLNFPNVFKSFPSGHASMGYYFISLIVLGYRVHKTKLKMMGLGLTLFFGGWLSLSRIAQGGHFFSDTLLSLVFLWYVALLCDWFVFEFLAKKTRLSYRKD